MIEGLFSGSGYVLQAGLQHFSQSSQKFFSIRMIITCTNVQFEPVNAGLCVLLP